MSFNGIEVRVRMPEGAVVPKYATPGSAGLDLIANDSVLIPSGSYRLVDTGMSIEIPDGFEAQVRPRSGLALKHAVTVLNSPGTIDADYRGPIGVILINHGEEDFQVVKGMRIAQLVFAKVYHTVFVLSDELSHTKRGVGGFGSTEGF